MTLLPHVEINPEQPPEAVIIWLHGLGADGYDFAPIVPELSVTDELPIRFIFPHAPSMPVTVNGGFVMPAWYDIMEMQIDRKVDIEQLKKSANRIEEFIDHEIAKGVPQHRIILAGFSQGGAVAYHTGLSGKYDLAGLMCLSTYIATLNLLADLETNQGKQKDLPLFVAHGKLDPVVPETLGSQAVANLKKMGYQPEYRTYPMEHAVSPKEIQDIDAWLKRVLLPEK